MASLCHLSLKLKILSFVSTKLYLFYQLFIFTSLEKFTEIFIIGDIAAAKIFESIHEIIEEIEEEYRILRDFNDHPNMPRFFGLYLKMGDMGTDDQLWMVMEVDILFLLQLIFS